MMDILFTQVGFWSAFTILFIFGFMGYFVWKVYKLSGEAPKDHTSS
ncbi:MAG: Unknown protein [uncultured Thiotrichaceae bacterium]|uniref:DUF3149 domain-containing protein n=1 Tax=uncultured Thiotrichaceae bacterium TaxID=298394 RepID=A0A6S6TRB7_9GAMM|nr:MAG: Unknown protein [uncultured Thiotrichaceae bacterium]